jgi:hypothetical protein
MLDLGLIRCEESLTFAQQPPKMSEKLLTIDARAAIVCNVQPGLQFPECERSLVCSLQSSAGYALLAIEHVSMAIVTCGGDILTLERTMRVLNFKDLS